MPINSFLLPGAKVTPAYEVANSLRLDDGSSPKLSRTPGSTGDRRQFTFSFWFKRSAISTGGYPYIFQQGAANTNMTAMYFDDDDRFSFYIENASGGGTTALKITNRMFRDPSAFLHVVVAVDTDQGTAANRIRLYFNGTEETSFETNTIINQNTDVIGIGQTVATYIGYRGTDDDNYSDGYLSEFVFIDGLQLTPSSFGEFDEDSPTIWKPKDVSGLTFGTNGFYLDFEDSGDLGDDESGNGNDFTETNLAATDQTTDTPTNNFCTFNPLYFRPGRTATTFSEGNCKSVHSDTGGTTPAWGTIALHHGKWYFEMKVIEEYAMYIGIWQTQGAWTNPGLYDGLSGVNTYRPWDGQTNDENVGLASYGDTYADDDIIGCAFDCDTGTIWFSKNGTWQNSATQAEVVAGTTTNAAFTGKAYSTNGVIPICTAYSPSPSSGASVEANFGNPSFTISSGNADDNGYGNFEYDVPTGYYAICTKNLAEFG
jgi:hypothetical protein